MLLAVAAVSALAFVFAGSGAAGTPAGVGCQADGKAAGQGATLQTRAQVAWIQGYTSDVCGNVGTAPANTMVTYNGINDNSQAISSPNGSGAGQRATSCRAVPFGGTDIPYDNNTLAQLNGTPGLVDGNTWFPSATECSANGFSNTGYQNPFYGTAGAYPFIAGTAAASDQTANVMSFPVGGTAVAVGVFWGLPRPAGCPATPQITGQQLSDLFGGKDSNWNQLGGAFASCNLAVRRDVRFDKSGTTQNFKNYLAAINPNGPLCDGSTWSTLAQDANNQNWPTTGGTCPNPSNLVRGVSSVNASGNPGVLDTCVGSNSPGPNDPNDPGPVPGTLCYADLPDFESTGPGNSTSYIAQGLSTAKLPAGATGTFVFPFSSTRANCDFSGVSTPANSSDGAVGLAPGDSWSTNNTVNNVLTYHEAVANQGTGWPACAVTFDLVYSGLSQPSAAATQPNRELNDDMRRTTYNYMLYVLSSEGQGLLQSIFYQNIPSGLLGQEVAGFKANY